MREQRANLFMSEGKITTVTGIGRIGGYQFFIDLLHLAPDSEGCLEIAFIDQIVRQTRVAHRDPTTVFLRGFVRQERFSARYLLAQMFGSAVFVAGRLQQASDSLMTDGEVRPVVQIVRFGGN